MAKNLGELKTVFYFDVCGQINTEKTLELAIQRAKELRIDKIIVASETGLTALKAAEMLQNTGIDLIVVTSAAGVKIEKTAIGDLRVGITNKKIWDQLEKSGARIVRGTDPFYNIGAGLERRGFPTLGTLMRICFGMISSGIGACVTTVLMATDNGKLREGEEVVAVAGSWVGLDSAVVIRAANSVDLLKSGGSVEIREIICKPRNPTYSWPVNQKDWVGNLENYKQFTDARAH